MATISSDDAFGLALIAKDPKSNKDLVKSLSVEARPIGSALVKPRANVAPEIAAAADALRKWAQNTSS
jgi:hypothetical protein